VNKNEELQRLEDSGDNMPFDQFEENKKKFGTKSTYDFNKYTTVIDESKITPEVRAKAD
jgi:PAB1-binding protein PBP1